MTYKYGEYSIDQIKMTKDYIRKQIFFLLLIADPNESYKYENVDVNAAIEGLLYKLGGLNKLLGEPLELVKIMSLIKAAETEYNNPDFQFSVYRRFVLDAGSEVLKIKED